MSMALFSVSFGSLSMHACTPRFLVTMTSLSWIRSLRNAPTTTCLLAPYDLQCTALLFHIDFVDKHCTRTSRRLCFWMVQIVFVVPQSFFTSPFSASGIFRCRCNRWHSFPITVSRVVMQTLSSFFSRQVVLPLCSIRMSSYHISLFMSLGSDTGIAR